MGGSVPKFQAVGRVAKRASRTSTLLALINHNNDTQGLPTYCLLII